MFTTVNEVMELTAFDVALEKIVMAQALIESYVGRVEAEVENANDLMLLGRATAYQAAYMQSFGDEIFDMASVTYHSTGGGSSVSFKGDGLSPFMAPLALIACQKLSWRRMRSIKTGSIYDRVPLAGGWTKE